MVKDGILVLEFMVKFEQLGFLFLFNMIVVSFYFGIELGQCGTVEC